MPKLFEGVGVMRGISSKEAAKRWGISQRRVQTYCEEGRIEGAGRLGRVWVIPADAVKPEDLRINPEVEKPPYWPFFFLLDSRLIQIKTTGEMLAGTDDPLKKRQLAAEIAYLRGDFEGAADCAKGLADDSPAYLHAIAFSTVAKVGLGESKSFQATWLKLDNLHTRFIDHPHNRRRIELVQGLLAISAYVPQRCPDWILNGVIGNLPQPIRQMALYLRARSLLALGRLTELISVAEATLSLSTGQNAIQDVYLYIILAHGYIYRDQPERAYDTLLHALNLCLPKGFLTPVVENISSLLGLGEQCLRKTYPHLIAPIMALHRKLSPSWLEVHNMLTREQITNSLTTREYQIALAVVGGLSNRECAERLGLSVSTIRGYLSNIYQKLNISSRKELKSFIVTA